MKQLSINDFFEAFNNSALCLNKLRGVTLDAERYYTDRHSYNFVVADKKSDILVKYFTEDSSKVQKSIELVSSFCEAPFVECEWLKDEVSIADTYGNTLKTDVACYRIDFKRNMRDFVSSLSYSEKCGEEDEKVVKSFLKVLKWLIDANISVDNISLNSFVVYETGDVKINIADNITVLCGETDDFMVHITSVLRDVLCVAVKGNCTDIRKMIIERFGTSLEPIFTCKVTNVDLLGIIRIVSQSDLTFVDDNTYENKKNVVNCFNSNRYEIEEELRTEDRIIVTDTQTNLKGYASYAGDLIIDCIYSDATVFYENCAVVVRDSKAGVINRDGAVIVDFVWEWIEWDYMYNVFRVNKDNYWQIIHRYSSLPSGKKYAYISSFDSGKAIAKDFNGKDGVIDVYGKEIVPFVYDSVVEHGEGRYTVITDDNKEFIYL